MRAGPSERVLASASSWGCRVSSWLGSSLLAGDVPVLSGRVSAVGAQVVPERVSFTVPPWTVDAGRTVGWLPRDPRSPLGRFGQTVDVTTMAGGVDTRIGRYLITGWQEQDDGSIQVDGAGVLQFAEDDRLLTATGPRDGGTLRSEFLRMLPGYMTAGFHPSLQDRAVPKTMEWDENRLDNLYKITDSWPARLRTDAWGQLHVLPPLPAYASPVLTIRDGAGGTLISAPTADTREGAYNVFVARSSADGVEAQAVARVQGGPMDPSGPYRPVPKFFASPLLLTEAQCLAAAVTMRDEQVRQTRIRKVTFAPDPRPELDDPVEIITGYGGSAPVRERGYIVGYDLPLTYSDGPSRADVAVL